MSGSHQLLRLDEEVIRPASPGIERQVLAAFAAAVATADAVVISDYAKGLLTDGVLAQAIGLARGGRADGGGRPQADRSRPPMRMPAC